MREIHLKNSTWAFDLAAPIGRPGGFGAVYRGRSTNGQEVAIKRLHIGAVESAHRELRVADLLAKKSASHLIPILDSGEDAGTGSYFIVMPIASESLQNRLERSTNLTETEARDILLQIALGLEELSGLVHRDLKPANILLHDGDWKLADFGIARFVEESTSLETLKDCLSPPYAAPEQWMYMRATPATDLYALGCIAFQLLTGSPPFPGPTTEDYREQHTMIQPPAVPDYADPQLRTIISMLLRKAPESRPDLKRVHDLLKSGSSGLARTPHPLAHAAARLELAKAKAESEAAVKRTELAARDRLAQSGIDSLSDLLQTIQDSIKAVAPSVTVDNFGRLRMGGANLSMPLYSRTGGAAALPVGSLPNAKIDLVSIGEIVLEQVEPKYLWGCSVMYAKFPNEVGYRWYEVGFRSTLAYEDYVPFGLIRSAGYSYPFRDIDLALGHIMHKFSTAFGPTPIDDEHSEEFIDRWMHLFALASEGKLRRPQGLPLTPRFWQNPHF